MRKTLLILALTFLAGLMAGIAVHMHWSKSEQVEVAQAETKAVRADAVQAVSGALATDTALGKRQDVIEEQTRAAIPKVIHYAKRPVAPARSAAPAHAPASPPDDPQPSQSAVCWADQYLSAGTVSVLNAHRAGVPLDRAALPSDAEGQAPSAVTAGDLFGTSVVDAGQYRELAESHDALVGYVEGLMRRQQVDHPK